MCKHNFDMAATAPIIAFELFIVIGTLAAVYILSKYERRILWRYFTVVAGVLIFELFTAPMWDNFNLGRWAYLYQDVSWILTLGWATLILSTVKKDGAPDLITKRRTRSKRLPSVRLR